MTRADLFDWVHIHGCHLEPLREGKAKLIKVINNNPGSNFGRTVFLNLPIDHRPVYDYTVCKTCAGLGIPIPTHVQYIKAMHDRLDRDHKNNL